MLSTPPGHWINQNFVESHRFMWPDYTVTLNSLYITDPLWGESTGHWRINITKGQWCFLHYSSEQAVEQRLYDVIVPHRHSWCRACGKPEGTHALLAGKRWSRRAWSSCTWCHEDRLPPASPAQRWPTWRKPADSGLQGWNSSTSRPSGTLWIGKNKKCSVWGLFYTKYN